VSILVDLSLPSASREVGFKFGMMPGEAFDLLIAAAAEKTGSGIFRFEDEVHGAEAANGESFEGTVGGRFVELFAEFPQDAVAGVEERWFAEIDRLIGARYPRKPRRPRTLGQRLNSAFIAVALGAVCFPLLAIQMLRPSFRRERAANRKKLQEQAAQEKPQGGDDYQPVARLIEVCRAAKATGEAVRYTWHI
jgi:hypothetical protein